ncbi:hypothetical protein ABZ921_22045 [Streptomyces atriruber]|uniref:HEAT repeat domain-containing protein n=1 Tax=Streptomyces atriruber TaxID=545121 RepID=A0ABV3BSB2_9ACTN
MGSAKRRLWEHLRELRMKAEAARRAQGLSVSQATVEREVKASGHIGAPGFSGQRINDWTPEEPGTMSVPQSRSHDRVVALAELWAEWAGDPAPGRALRDLLDEACDEWKHERTNGASGRASAEHEASAGRGTPPPPGASPTSGARPTPGAPPTPTAPTAHRTATDLTPWLLEVREAPLPDRPAEPPALTPYLSRDHDHALREYLESAVSGGPSALGVLTGDSSTGKTRALYEAVLAVAPDRRLLRPPTARALLDLIAAGEVGGGCVLWLNEVQRILLDREGNDAAVELTTVLQEQPGIVAVATLWEDPYWRRFTAQGRDDDPARHTRLLLTGAHARRFRVPRRLTPEELDEWRQLARDREDARLHSAGRAGAADGQVVQHLSGGPELLDAYLSGPEGHFTAREHALVTAALDARRLGHQTPPGGDLLAAAADASLAPHHRASHADWAGPDLAALTDGVRGDGSRADIRSTLTPLRAVRESAGARPRYEPADYLLQHTAPPHAAPAGTAALWEALIGHTHDTEDLHRLQAAAWRRGLFRYALRLDRRAALAGSDDAYVRILERTRRHPDAARAAVWVAAHVDPSDGRVVEELLTELHAAGVQEAVDTLARRVVGAADPADVQAVGELALRLAAQGVTAEVVDALVDSLAAHVDRTGPEHIIWALPHLVKATAGRPARRVVGPLAHRAAVHADLTNTWRTTRLLEVLGTVGEPRAAAVLAARIVDGAPDLDPDELPWLIGALQAAGAEHAAHDLLALDPATRTGLTDVGTVSRLLQVLGEAGDEGGVRTLLGRSPARHIDVVGHPDFFDIASVLCQFLMELRELRELGAEEEFAMLAERVAEGADLEDPGAMASLLDLFHHTGRPELVRRVLARQPVAELFYEDPEELRGLLCALLTVGAEAEFEALVSEVVSHVTLTAPDDVGEVIALLWEVGGERALAPLLAAALAHTPADEMFFLVRELSLAGAEVASARLARHIAEHIERPSVDAMEFVLWAFTEVGRSEAVEILFDRGLLDGLDTVRYEGREALAGLVDTLCAAGKREAAREIADRAAAGIALTDVYAISTLLKTLTAHGFTRARTVLIRRAAAGAGLSHVNSVARLIEEFLAAGADDAVDVLLRRDPLGQIDRGWATESCHEALVAALRKAGAPQGDEYARWARGAGELPVESCLPHGVELDGSPAAPWSWASVMEQP